MSRSSLSPMQPLSLDHSLISQMEDVRSMHTPFAKWVTYGGFQFRYIYTSKLVRSGRRTVSENVLYTSWSSERTESLMVSSLYPPSFFLPHKRVMSKNATTPIRITAATQHTTMMTVLVV